MTNVSPSAVRARAYRSRLAARRAAELEAEDRAVAAQKKRAAGALERIVNRLRAGRTHGNGWSEVDQLTHLAALLEVAATFSEGGGR